ncbi:putative YkwD family protein [Paenibacillus forsythiae]|uniref:YkwD family protein n=1 Tax=Paenibacillus forsythiae TaxID=365616 RepID=A0ABU3H7E1_9BACL|nr:CAP domain-containing protein [Paenibacillus forsythiae]MDT3426746.1 putative YkwD family protein [Paenibacillus forsythiae]
MKSNLIKALLSGSVAAVMALGISIPSQADAASAQVTVKNGISYDQLMQYLQQTYGKSFTFDVPGNLAGSPAENKPEAAPAAKPAVTKPEATPVAEPAPTVEKAPESVQADKASYVGEVVALVNEERAKAGLAPLTALDSLNKVAAAKATDMRSNNYFSHTSPTYGSPFDMMSSFGVTYNYAGENIAMGQRTPEEVMKAWMNSPGHKANILSKNFNYIGVGFDNNYWAQEFIGK